MYIDAEGTFRPQRLLQIADRYNDSLYCFVDLCVCVKCAFNIYVT
jgi:hypothetical protein